MAKQSQQRKPAQKARSAAARRRRKSKRKYTLYYLLALVFILAAGVVLSMTVFFRIESVTVSGSTRYADGELIKTAGISMGDNLFRLNTGQIEQTLVEKYPYIAAVAVRRKLPVSVVLDVTQAEPAAAIETSGGFLLLDARGRVLEDSLAVCPQGYPRAVGFSLGEESAGDFLEGEQAERFMVLRDLETAIKQSELTDIDVVDLTDPLNLWLLYDGRVAIELGSRTDFDYKLRSAKNIIDSSVDSELVGKIDVSVRPVARLREMDIYDEQVWPFPADMLDDYERSIVREVWQPPAAEQELTSGDAQPEKPTAEPPAEAEQQAESSAAE